MKFRFPIISDTRIENAQEPNKIKLQNQRIKKRMQAKALGDTAKPKFEPKEVPPPMHLIGQKLESELKYPEEALETPVVFELTNLIDKIPNTSSRTLDWMDRPKEQQLKPQTAARSVKQESFAFKPEPAPVLRTSPSTGSTYTHPPLSLLQPYIPRETDEDWVFEESKLLDHTLKQFNVNAHVVSFTQGPSVTRFELQPAPGVKVSKITNLSDDLKLSLAAKEIRIEAPIPGTRSVGIEVPNHDARPVFIHEILQDDSFMDAHSPLSVAVGLDVSGAPVVTDLGKMPHGLVAGSTGSGKSVFINSLLISLLYKSSPADVRLLLIDPKMVELAAYNGIPHLISPVVTDPKTAVLSLKWAVDEMDRRYETFVKAGVRDIARFNEMAAKPGYEQTKMPYIVVIIDELADLMMTASSEVEASICRIAQKARAAGIHLIIATQRPSVDVITGLIKANVPSRIAFSVASQIDSRTILDQVGAEKLLGRGDMLFLENGVSKPIRLQGTFVTDDEIADVVAHARGQGTPEFLFLPADLEKFAQSNTNTTDDEQDSLFFEACQMAVEAQTISTSSLQRRFRIGYNRAARLIDLLESYGVVSGANGSKPRDVLISEGDLEILQEGTKE